MVADNASKGIGEVEYLSLRVRRICTAIHRGDPAVGGVKLHGRNLVRKVLGAGKEEWIIDAVLRTIVKATRRVDTQACRIVAGRYQNLVEGCLLYTSPSPRD